MDTRATTVTDRTIRLCRMMALVVLVAMLPARHASADLPCGDKNAEMPRDLAAVLHKLREEIEAGDTTYLSKLIVPNVHYQVWDPMLFALNRVLESESVFLTDIWPWDDWSNALASDCEAVAKNWICLSQTEALPTTRLRKTFVHVGNLSGTVLKEAPRESSATVAKIGCRAFLDIDGRAFYYDGVYWRKGNVVGDKKHFGYVKNDDLVYDIGGSVTFGRVGGIWRIVGVGVIGIN